MTGMVVPPVDSLPFKVAFDTFSPSIIETITGAAHAADKAKYFLQKPSVLPAGILRSADALLNVKQQSGYY